MGVTDSRSHGDSENKADRESRSSEIERAEGPDAQFLPNERANGSAILARVLRRVRLLIPNTSGDVRAELEEIAADVERMLGPGATVVPIRGGR
jgi:hypothetical protein